MNNIFFQNITETSIDCLTCAAALFLSGNTIGNTVADNIRNTLTDTIYHNASQKKIQSLVCHKPHLLYQFSRKFHKQDILNT